LKGFSAHDIIFTLHLLSGTCQRGSGVVRLPASAQQAAKLESGETTKEDYDQWRYNYPQSDTSKKWAKVPSQELSDYLVNELKNKSDKKK